MDSFIYVIVHLGANQMMNDGSGIAGAISHYARLEDAVKHCKYIQTVTDRRRFWSDDSDSYYRAAYDFMGHPFQDVPNNCK